MIRLVRSVCAAAAVAAAVPAYGQSLGELARQEEARRATTEKKAVKTLSNADLRPQDIAGPSTGMPAESCYMSIRLGRCVSAEELMEASNAGVLTKQNAPTEQRWRNDAQSIRSRVESFRSQIATLEAVIAAEGRSSDKPGAERMLVKARQALDSYERQWEKLEMAAANQRIPRVWIEPIPTLPTKTPQ